MHHIPGREPHIEMLRKAGAGLRLFVTIVNRTESSQTALELRKLHFSFIFCLLAKGTAGAGFADLIGFGPPDKSVLFCVAPGLRAAQFLTDIKNSLRLDKPGRGIAFTIPLCGIALPKILPVDDEHNERIQKQMKKGVTSMLGDIEHELIVAIVNQGFSEALMECAHQSGVAGGTMLSARHFAVREAVAFLGVPVQSEKEILAILASAEEKPKIMKELSDFMQNHPKSQGVLLAMPVDGAVGLSRQ